MLQTNNQKFSKQEKQTIISLLLIGLFIVLVAYMNNPNESTFPVTVKTEIK